jgi:hypothetical protein
MIFAVNMEICPPMIQRRFFDAHQAFIQAKIGLIHSFNSLESEKCISIVLQNINKLLNQFILREQRISQINLEEHQKVKDDFIKNHGHDAWYRNDPDAIKRHTQSSTDMSNTLAELESMRDVLHAILINYIHLSDLSPTAMNSSSSSSTTQYLQPFIDPPQLLNYLLYHCINGMSEACFNLAVNNNLLPYMLPIPSSNWPFTNEIISDLQSELRQMDQLNLIPIRQPKDPWIILGHYIMAILTHTDMLSLSHQDLTACLNDYLPMNPALAKSIEIYQQHYLQQHVSNQVNHLASLSMFSGTVNTQEQPRAIQDPTPSSINRAQ